MAHTSQSERLSGSMGPSKSRLAVSGQDPLMKSEQRAIDMRKWNKQQKLASNRQNMKAPVTGSD
jgi:hypothetical protein